MSFYLTLGALNTIEHTWSCSNVYVTIIHPKYTIILYVYAQWVWYKLTATNSTRHGLNHNIHTIIRFIPNRLRYSFHSHVFDVDNFNRFRQVWNVRRENFFSFQPLNWQYIGHKPVTWPRIVGKGYRSPLFQQDKLRVFHLFSTTAITWRHFFVMKSKILQLKK